jgi:hypothetical protein
MEIVMDPTKSKEMAILLKIRVYHTMPTDDLIEYVRICLRRGGIDLSLIDIQSARPLGREDHLRVDGVSYTNKSIGTQKNIDNDPASHDNPTTTT